MKRDFFRRCRRCLAEPEVGSGFTYKVGFPRIVLVEDRRVPKKLGFCLTAEARSGDWLKINGRQGDVKYFPCGK